VIPLPDRLANKRKPLLNLNLSFYNAFSVILLTFSLLGCGQESNETFPIKEIPSINASYSREQVLEVAQLKYLTYAESHNPDDGYPRADDGVSGQWMRSPMSWSSGFFPGVLWQLYYLERQDDMYQQAVRWTLPLSVKADWDVHDVGFVIDYSFGKGSRIDPNAEFDHYRKLAADTLLARFNSKVGATRSWNDNSVFVVIIDNMMNLGLLFDAAHTFANDAYYQAAYAHMLTTAKEFVRPNGSSYHVVTFDGGSGEVLQRKTAQGLSAESTWARGQAWGIYGFAMAYHETGDTIALETARIMANFYLHNLPVDNIPNWDFDDSASSVPKDTSAAAIAATGLWLLGKQLSSDDGRIYQEASVNLINALLNEDYLSIDPAKSVLLKHATGNKPGNFEVDVSLIYADYFLIEAILLQSEIIDWPL
jgi:unsaturated chondroitin disaccharide hydrolase